MSLPEESVAANTLPEVTTIPTGKKLIFTDPDTNEGGIITLENLTKQILQNLTTQTFGLDQGNLTLLQAINQLNSKTTLKTYQGSDISSYFGRIYISKNLGLSRPSSIIIFGYEGMGIALFESMYVNSLPKQAVNIYGNILTQTDDKTVLVNFSDRNRQVTIISPQGIEIEVASVE